MKTALIAFVAAAVLLPTPRPVAAQDPVMIESFEFQPQTRWRFFTDNVMGGVSTGQVTFHTEAGQTFARLTGSVSTENSGGFIQIRRDLTEGAPQEAAGVRLIVRGNGQRYFIHLRTSGTVLPWQYYQSGFDVTADWREIRLPLDSFKPSGSLLRPVPRAGSLKSIAVVAFGRDHEAQIDVKEIGFY